MAVDAALAEAVAAGGRPFLRFYTWNPGTLSLGRFQNPSSGLSEAARGVPRVRRTTGGGAIWHDDELTYSLGCRQEHLGELGVKASFERLCGFLVDAWKSLGIPAQFAKDSAPDAPSLGAYTPACFAGKEAYDIVVNGKKLGGNAQRRDKTSVFQHGSLPLSLDFGLLDRLFAPGFAPQPREVTDLRTLGWTRGPRDLIPILLGSFAARVDASVGEDGLSSSELLRAEELLRTQFADQSWTETGGGSLRA